MEPRETPRRRKRRRRRRGGRLLLCLMVLLIAGACVYMIRNQPGAEEAAVRRELAAFARKNDLSVHAWPDELIQLAVRNPEAMEFVQNYPLKKDLTPDIDLSEYRGCDSVPLLMQWDQRWGYSEYAGEPMGISGCGPTCLSMVSIYLQGDSGLDPRAMAQFSAKNGYSVDHSGSAWALMAEGGRKLGLDVTQLPLDKNRILRNLEVGNPIICIMGPGDFTAKGHFIVLTGYEDGKIRLNDPNSAERSAMDWDYDQIAPQIRNLWAFRR